MSCWVAESAVAVNAIKGSEDVAESEKIKRAESKFMRRQSEDF